MEKIKCAILGATGSVGQKFIELLTNHPWFEAYELAASERSAGKKYKDAVNWVQETPLDEKIANLIVKDCKPGLESKICFSALDSSVAGETELEFARAGYIVISNSKNHRMDKDVPLVIPEANPDHLELIKSQNYNGGAIITNPNCSTIGLTMALKPLHDKFKLEAVNVVTMQAVSGAGYPGLSSMDIFDNVIPFIGGEEDKIETEPKKILGQLKNGEIEYENFKVSAQCNRVPVINGHLECVQASFKKKPNKDEIIEAWKSFKSETVALKLPSAPNPPLVYFEEDQYPQPRKHRNLGGGMTTAIGRLRECDFFDYKFVVLSHNTVRGAAGGALLIGELLKSKGYFTK